MPPRAKLYWKNSEARPKVVKLGRRQGLDEDIYQLVLAGEKRDLESFGMDTVTNKMIINIHMLSAGMHDRIHRKICSL